MVFKKIWKGLQIVAESVLDLNTKGQIQVDDSTGKAHYHNGTSASPIVTEAHTATLTNKTIDADNNPITNIDNDSIKAAAGIVESKLALDHSTSSLNTAINNHINDTTDAHDASAISNSPTGNLAATDVQGALNELQGDIDTLNTDMTAVEGDVADLITLSGVAANSTDLGTFTGTTIPDNSDVKEALQALETEVESKIDSADLTNHMSDTTTHGTTGDIVGTSDTQTLTNKTIVATNNTITTAASGNLTSTELNAALDELQDDIDTRATSSALTTHTSASSGVHGVTGSVVGTSDAQVLTNKDIDGGTASNSNRITLPKASKSTLDGLTRKEATLVYASDLDKVYYDDGTNLRAVGSGTGSSINYIENGDAEVGTIGWTTYDDGAAIPVDGTGGSLNRLTFSQNTTNPLRGAADYKMSVLGLAGATGEGVSYSFSVDDADLAKQLVISFDYIANDSDYTDGLLSVFIIADPNGTPSVIRVNGESIVAGSGTHYARFQTLPNVNDYRLCIHITADTIAAYDFYFDNVQVGPKAIVYGSPMTDWTSYTPGLTSTTNVSLNEARYRRVGGNMEIEGRLNWSGVGAGANFTVDIPTNVLMDSSLVNTTSGETHFGTATWTDSGTSFKSLHVRRSNNTSFSFWEIGANNIWDGTQAASGDVLSYHISIPIAGWSANSAMSEDFSGRDVRVTCSGNSGIAITANSTLVTFTEVEDTTASFSGTTFTAPEKGEYLFTGSTKYTTNVARFTRPVVNGTHNGEFSGIFSSTATVNPFTFKLKLEKGDTVAFQETVGGTLDNTSAHVLKIEKLQSAQQIFETETVAAIYNNCVQNISTSTDTVLTFDNMLQDTHGAYNTSTGEFTAPHSGYYQVNASAGITSGSADTGRAYLYIVGPDDTVYGTRILMTTITITFEVASVIYLSKGQTITINISQTSGTTRAMSDAFCNLSIIRVK